MITKYEEYITEGRYDESYLLKTYDEIKAWLDKDSPFMRFKNYTINEDLTVDAEYVNLSYCRIHALRVQFNKIEGDFYINDNRLRNLEGFPKQIGGIISCRDNDLYNINDLDINLLDKFILDEKYWVKPLRKDAWNKYFKLWIDREPDIFFKLKDKVGDSIKRKYSHLFNANNFDLL